MKLQIANVTPEPYRVPTIVLSIEEDRVLRDAVRLLTPSIDGSKILGLSVSTDRGTWYLQAEVRAE